MSHGHLTRRAYPLSWRTGEEIPIENVVILSVESRKNDDGERMYDLQVYRRNGRRVLLYTSDEASRAEHVQRWVEAALAVAGPQ